MLEIDRLTLQRISEAAIIRAHDERSKPRTASFDQRADAFALLARAADACDALIARDELNALLGHPPQIKFPDGYEEDDHAD